MALSFFLLVWSAMMFFIAPLLLRRWRALSRAPKLALAGWHAAAASGVCAFLLALVVASHNLLEIILGWLIGAGHESVDAAYGLQPNAVIHIVATNVLILVTVRLLWVQYSYLRMLRRLRGEHRTAVRLARPAEVPPAGHAWLASEPRLKVIDAPEPAAFCIPGRRPSIVVTTGACERLTAEEMEAVLEHEQTHLRQRHHHLHSIAAVLRRGFPMVPLFRLLPAETSRYGEMAADDGAVHRSGVLATASALLGLSAHPPLSPALHAAGGNSTAERVTRLLQRRDPVGTVRGLLAVGASALAIALPFAVVGTPAVGAGSAERSVADSICPFI